MDEDRTRTTTTRPAGGATGLRERMDAGSAPAGFMPIGTTVATGEPLPAAGVWVLERHPGDGGDCPWGGWPTGLGAGAQAPACPDGHAGRWRLEHLAPSAADEGGVDR